MRPLFTPALCVIAFSVSACEGIDGREPLTSDESDLYVNRSHKWNFGSMPNGLRVCWLKSGLKAPSNYYPTERLWVQDQIQKTWVANSRVKFQWDVCPYQGRDPNVPGCPFAGGQSCNTVFVTIEDSGSAPHTNWLGNGGTSFNGITFNFTFNNWSTICQSSRESCIRAIAVHEFGHVLSFAHEQNRPDTPSTCNQRQGDNGDFTFGLWDLSSVMNYCNPNWNNGGLLSPTDIQGAQFIYGAP